MATLYAVAGQKIYIGSAPVELEDIDLVAADFDGVTWIEIKKWSQMGAIGDAAALITTALIDRSRDVKQKGTRNAGSMQNNFGLSLSDAGQLAMMAAEKTNQNYPFRIVGNDAPAIGVSPQPSERMFHALVMSAQEAGGQANTGQMLNSTLELNSNIVIIEPNAGEVPGNLVKPAISGIAQQGVQLYCWPGQWENGVDDFTYQWKNEGANIVGATNQSYTPIAGDVGDNLTCTVTATNTAGSASATTAETLPVLAP